MANSTPPARSVNVSHPPSGMRRRPFTTGLLLLPLLASALVPALCRTVFPDAGPGLTALLPLSPSPAQGAPLPAGFVVRKLAELSKDTPSLALECSVQGLDANATPQIQKLFLKGGKARSESARGLAFYPPPATAAAQKNSAEDDEGLRVPVFEALMLQPGKGIVKQLQKLGIPVTDGEGTGTGQGETEAGAVASPIQLVRQATPDLPLPWRVVYHIGSPDPTGAFIDIDKDKFLLRRAQLRLADGGLWLAEYEGHGQLKDLPWLPTRITLYRGGIRMETLTITSRLSSPVPDSLFGGSTSSPPTNPGPGQK